MKSRRLEDLPPKIQELLHKKGWTYPPDDELKRQWWEASKRFDGKVHTDPEILREIYLEKSWTWIDGTECKAFSFHVVPVKLNEFLGNFNLIS